MEQNKRKSIESLNNNSLEETSSFNDIMSRSELRRRINEKELENSKQDSFNNTSEQKEELTNTFNDIMSKSERKKIAKQQKDDFKNQDLNRQKREKESAIQQEQIRKQEKSKAKKNQTNTSIESSNKNGPFLTFILIIILLFSISYFIYNLIYQKDNPNQLYLLVNSGSIAILTLFFGLALKVKKKVLKTMLQILTSILFVVYITGTVLINLDILKFPSKVTIENFANKNITEAMKWAEENDIDLNIKYDFSDVIEKNTIIKQDVEPNTLASKVDNLELVVSDGPNYDLVVNVPNMVGWNIDDVVEKIEELKLNNVNIDYQFSETIERDLSYEQSKDGEMRRKDELIMKFSLGNENDLSPIKLIDLKNKTEFKATLWLKRNGVKYDIKYEYSDNIEYGKIISTNPKKDTTIDQAKDKVELTISKGKKIIAPDLTKMTLNEIIEWANKNRITVTYDSEYDDTIKSGKVKRASVKKGDIIDQGKTVHVIMSKGKLKMIDYDDNSLDKIKKFAEENGVSIEIVEEYSESIAKGHIIDVSHKKGQVIKNDDTIKLKVSKGKATKIPNLIGLTTSEAKNKCNNSNLVCTFDYVYSNETKDTVIYQNKASGTEVIEGSSISLSVSNGPAPAGQSNYTPPTNNTSGGSSNGGNSGGGSTPTPPPTPTCYDKTLYYGAGATGAQTKAIIASSASKIGITISYSFVTSCSNGDSANGVVCPESTIYSGMTANTCNTYTAVIVNY